MCSSMPQFCLLLAFSIGISAASYSLLPIAELISKNKWLYLRDTESSGQQV